ncbi:hypothetical protein C8R46DRAFT_387217 [Mycena filopes]|nr:hypothetical protein C8R46DRAFT_387217 [Mycena filopes]
MRSFPLTGIAQRSTLLALRATRLARVNFALLASTGLCSRPRYLKPLSRPRCLRRCITVSSSSICFVPTTTMNERRRPHPIANEVLIRVRDVCASYIFERLLLPATNTNRIRRWMAKRAREPSGNSVRIAWFNTPTHGVFQLFPHLVGGGRAIIQDRPLPRE